MISLLYDGKFRKYKALKSVNGPIWHKKGFKGFQNIRVIGGPPKWYQVIPILVFWGLVQSRAVF